MVLKIIARYLPQNYLHKLMKNIEKNPEKLKNFLMSVEPEFLEEIGRKRALHMFRLSAKRVPHYKKFLDKNKIKAEEIKVIEHFLKHVPSIDKKNYIRVANSLKEMCIDNSIDKVSLLVRSSGFSGKPCTWAKSRKEQEDARNFATLGLDETFKTSRYRTLLINGFALGSWVSGIDLLKIADGQSTIISPGLVEDEVIEIFNDLKNEFEQVIMAGNPHFLKDVIEKGQKMNANWKHYRVNLLSGGEPLTESLRDYLYEQLGTTHENPAKGYIYSAFGSSDIGVVGINETHDSVVIRKLAKINPRLKKMLFGDVSTLPMLFQYDPTTYFISVNNKNELEFTTCNLNVAKPLIKYNIHDIGGVISYKKMTEILKDFRINVKIKMPLPFVYVVGRSDGTVSFCSSLIYPETIKESLHENKKTMHSYTGKFRLRLEQKGKQDEKLCVDVQLKKKIKTEKKLAKLFEKVIEESLLMHNLDFKQDYLNIKKHGKKALKIKLYEFEKYPYKDKIKIRHI